MFEEGLDQYNEDEAEEFALAMAEKAYAQAVQNGVNETKAQEIAQEKYNEVRKRHALEFLKKVEERLSSLSNQAVADLLRILIALGLDIEDEEELEAWINRLTQEVFNRINLYFNERDNISHYRQLTSKPQSKKILYNLKNYSIKDIKILSSMIKSLHLVNDKKTKNEKSHNRRKDILKKIENTLNKDIKLKENQQKQQNKQSHRRREEKQTSESKDDSFAVLTGKMTAEGVEQGGRYWNEVVSEYNKSDNKNDFATNWQIDNTLRNDLDIRHQNDKQREDERFLAENEEHQRQELENQRKQQEQANYLKQQEQQQDINLRQAALNKQALDDKQKRQLEKLMEKRGIKEPKSNKTNNENKSNKNKLARKIASQSSGNSGR